MRAYERFLKYAAYPTMSSEETGTHPSTEKQLVLARELARELCDMGLDNVEVDEWGYVYAELPSNVGTVCNNIGFIAHMDTSSEASDENIKTRLVSYGGGDILLNEEKDIWLKVSDYPYVEEHKGETLIVSDGTTLIGADDKAGIAEIMTALEVLIEKNMPHGKISVAFTPDEEIGEGADNFRVDRFGAEYAYTVDGGGLGELEYENFNAASCKVEVRGVSIHPGSAKDRMKNAARIAAEFDSRLPKDEIPERTEGYEGFHHLLSITGATEEAKLVYIIRDHDRAKFEEKKRFFEELGKQMNTEYGEGTVTVNIKDSYYNMREKVEDNIFVVERAKEAMRSLGIEPIVMPIRGGTDGSRLSFMGLPCPNLCTGGANFHSRFEYVCVESMDKITELIVKIAEDVAKSEKMPLKA
ncbi:MAG: peptidase T [Clostridia bacterium]|nr:peptidase T [Clostridia bacterium]